MSKSKTILLDLDGTLANSLGPSFKVYRDGKSTINPHNVPLIDGAKTFVENLKSSGNQVFIVSDSHPSFVKPISEQIFGLDSLSLAYKPTIDKIRDFLNKKSQHSLTNARSRIFMIGDHPVDIVTARKLGLPSIHVMHKEIFQPELWSITQKWGPTFSCRNFREILEVIDNPADHLLCLEGIEYSEKSDRAIHIGEIDYSSSEGRRFYKVALARQETGLCDRFGKGVWYRQFGDRNRGELFLKKLAQRVEQYIFSFQSKNHITFDMISFVPDKKTTIPPNKMGLFANIVGSSIPVKQLFYWTETVEGSIRNRPKRKDRVDFVSENVRFCNDVSVVGKNVIVIDDQITTGATMDVITEILKNNGANHILFIALFRMITEIGDGKKCPKCGKEMSVRKRKVDGSQFYSCVPSKYGGTGCGNIENMIS